MKIYLLWDEYAFNGFSIYIYIIDDITIFQVQLKTMRNQLFHYTPVLYIIQQHSLRLQTTLQSNYTQTYNLIHRSKLQRHNRMMSMYQLPTTHHAWRYLQNIVVSNELPTICDCKRMLKTLRNW